MAVDPARPLLNLKHERFCNLLVRGKDRMDAFEAAGFPRHRGNVIRLLKRPEVKARIDYLLEQAAKVTVYDAAWIKDRLAKHAENLTEYLEDEDGTKRAGPLFNASAGVRALEMLGREHGMFKEKIELGGRVQVANRELFEKLTPDERSSLRSMLMAAASRLPAPAANENEDQPARGVV